MDANVASLSALGQGQLTSLGSAVAVSTVSGGIPAGTQKVLLEPEAQNVRYRDDGTDPTSGVGILMVANTVYEFDVAQIPRMKVIETTGSAKLNISFYGTRTGTVSWYGGIT